MSTSRSCRTPARGRTPTPRPVWTNPTTTFETGLGVFATTSMNVWANLGLVRRMLSKKPRIEAKHLIRDDDLPWVRVTSDTPVACQIDGDYLGPRRCDDVHSGS